MKVLASYLRSRRRCDRRDAFQRREDTQLPNGWGESTDPSHSPCRFLGKFLDLAGVKIIDLVDKIIGVGGFHIEIL
jgi:hypothetical protein